MDINEQQIADSLARHAADAPSDHALLSTVHGCLRRRRTGRAVGAVVLAAAVVATAFTATNTLRTEPEVAQTKPGWHWESYKTAQIQVPDTWDKYIAGPAPCGTWGSPTIGRWFDWQPRDRYTCDFAVFPLKDRQPYVWFGDVQAPGIKQYDGGWSEETRLVSGTKVSVLAPSEAMRREIMDTARPIARTDAYGCAPTDTSRASGTPAGEVDGAEVCQYARGSLVSSSHLPPRLASQLALTLGAGLPGRSCDTEEPRIYVVTLHSGLHTWTVRREERPCQLSDRLGLDGTHHPYDPSSLFDGPRQIPPQR
ncbi:hypothetical protein ACIA49_41565 [Kribbella sp. NPDC051587]|uniref:hypothetical protein n=1 Tax=Kribbella sp. NPDC051587 TaxID=3364119 RepID=UPI0037AF46BE